MSKKIKVIIAIIIFMVVIGFMIYYFFLKKPADPYAGVFDWRIVKTDLEPWEIEKFSQEFLAVKESLQQDANQLDGWMQLGMLKKFVGDYKGAEQAWLKANEIRPKNSLSFHALADLYVNFTKEYAKAEPMYRQAIANSLGEQFNILYYRNFFYYYRDYLHQPDKAEEVLLEGIQDNPQSADLVTLLASFYEEKGENSQAIEYYQKSLELYPDNEAVKKALENLKRKN